MTHQKNTTPSDGNAHAVPLSDLVSTVCLGEESSDEEFMELVLQVNVETDVAISEDPCQTVQGDAP